VPTFKKSAPKPNRYNCDAERHLWTYGLSLAIYTKIGSVTAGGKNPFYGKISKLSGYFGSNEEATRRAFKRLLNGGWLVALPQAGCYKWVDHDPRADVKKDCAEMEELPHWSLDADPFIGELHAASGGKLRVMPNWAAAARENCTEAEFLAELRHAFQANSAGSASTQFWNVVRHFRRRATGRKENKRVAVESPALK
jgi:hypothetical protein